jgi:hypothetical protein
MDNSVGMGLGAAVSEDVVFPCRSGRLQATSEIESRRAVTNNFSFIFKASSFSLLHENVNVNIIVL